MSRALSILMKAAGGNQGRLNRTLPVLGCGLLLCLPRASAAVDAESGPFALDTRYYGNSADSGSAEFVLNTLDAASTTLEVTGPATLAGGASAPLHAIWHAGSNNPEVTAAVRWRFLTTVPDGTVMVANTLHAGAVTAPAIVRLVASYLSPTGRSQDSAPFAITITPGMTATVTAARQDAVSGVVNFSATVQGASGAATIKWDLDRDGQFDDATGAATTSDYGSWTGSVTVVAEITDAASNRIVKSATVILNKPPVANQPLPATPAADPGAFQLFNADPARTSFGFLPSRKPNGLVVIVHGLDSDAKQPWLHDMATAIGNRCGTNGTPNIALFDWSPQSNDPTPLPAWQQTILQTQLENGIRRTGNPAMIASLSGMDLRFAVDLWGVRESGLTSGQQLADWIYRNSLNGAAALLDPNQPIHLIGHGAGGFVAGEAAHLLKRPLATGYTPVMVDRVTLLDTPFPARTHFTSDSTTYPNPGRVDRYVSSLYGDADLPTTWLAGGNSWYVKRHVMKSDSPQDILSSGENGHGWSYRWFTEQTIQNPDPIGALENDGFAFSPVINSSTRIAKPYTAPAPTPTPPGTLPDFALAGWQTFGNAAESSGVWTLTESADAGIWQQHTLPAGAASLAFEFHYANAGDGDFLAVHYGDGPVLFRGLDLPLSRVGWIPAEIPLDLFPVMTGKVIFTLVSRGNPNAVLQLRNLRIIQSADPDGDTLATTAESTAGTDARNADSDGDGLSDGAETLQHRTDPLRADSDGDGQSDAAELAAGTSPLQNGSWFRVTAVSKTAQGFALRWTGVAGKTYRVVRSQELGTGNFEVIATRVAGVAPLTNHTDPSPPAGRAFYWIEVE